MTKFERGYLHKPTPEQIKGLAEAGGVSEDEIRKSFADQEKRLIAVWINDLYQVNVLSVAPIENWPDMVWLSIKRKDKQPIHDWRHLQRIKNEIIGPENEAVELYPAESRLADSANQYHLWVIKDPEIKFPFGFKDRLVSGASGGGAIQRPFEE